MNKITDKNNLAFLSHTESNRFTSESKHISSLELKHYFDLYKNFKQTFADPLSNVKVLNESLQFIIEKAFLSDEQDSEFIVQLIHAQIDNDANSHFLLPCLSGMSSIVPASFLMEFLLFHSNRQKALFYGQRLVALPSHNGYCSISSLELAIKMHSSSLLRCLLRYGAVWSYLNDYGERIRFQWPLQALPRPSIRLCADVICYLVESFKKYNPQMADISELVCLDKICCEKLISCGDLILRDTPNLQFRFLYNDYLSEKEVKRIIKRMDAFLPGLEERFTSPLSLKHCCKLTIRKRLNDNWQLPQGIYKLELPNHLISYLDLYCD